MHVQTSFPQAESFAQVMDLLQRIQHNSFSREYALTYFDIETRQIDFYLEATIYLGLAEKYRDYDEYANEEDFFYELSPLGRNVMEMEAHERNLAIVKCMLQHQIFSRALDFYSKRLALLTQQQAAEIVKELHSNASQIEIERCSATVVNWTDWILEQTRR